MPSPSRGGGPAAMPKYQWIAAALRRELRQAGAGPGGRLPSERALAARYGVNRQTVRAALRHLREEGLVVTERRGSRSAAAADPAGRAGGPDRRLPAHGPARPDRGLPGAPHVPPHVTQVPQLPGGRAAGAVTAGAPPAAAHLPGAVRAPAAVSPQNWLALVTVPPSLGALLGMRGGERTLVHHRRDRGPAGQTLRHAVTYLCPRVAARTPELAGYLDRAAARDEDLGPLHRWLDRAAEEGRVAETLTMTRSSHPPAAASACGLTVRRTLHDRTGRLLAVTDLAFPTWDRLTFHRDRPASGFRIS
ncbi:GntR family transcriptional regulator [Streptomyces sp. NPDC046866]|uniref:GntR family transcriptional regulator n=1 Tax=Streptomyces sp. NPDC046866 TaxID=3154921 RepID=UPI00345543D1